MRTVANSQPSPSIRQAIVIVVSLWVLLFVGPACLDWSKMPPPPPPSPPAIPPSPHAIPLDQSLNTFVGHSGSVRSVAFSPNGHVLASGSDDRTIKLWDTRTGRQIRTMKGHRGAVLGVDFSTDGQQLVSCSADRTIKLWNLSAGSAGTFIMSTNRVYIETQPGAQNEMAPAFARAIWV